MIICIKEPSYKIFHISVFAWANIRVFAWANIRVQQCPRLRALSIKRYGYNYLCRTMVDIIEWQSSYKTENIKE